MYRVKWDPENNGVILSNSIDDQDSLFPPRVVFTEELKTLGLDRKFKLPSSNEPVCWEENRKYFYKGKCFAETKGGNIYDDPEVIVYPDAPERLDAINMDRIVEINAKAIDSIQDEAKDFIKDKYEYYLAKNVSGFVVAFSGGKDSQVILDLVSQVIPPEKYTAVFTNTGMELPCTIETMVNTEKFYKEKNPNFTLIQAKSDRNSLDLWKRYGPPSRMNRWCCSVLKTALFGRKMKELLKTNSQPRLVVFEGVRNDESARREKYNRVGEGVKHVNLINCRPIIKWNVTEIYLYLFSRHVKLNPAYTIGLTRVGCGVCPFASDWSEFVIRKRYPEVAADYIGVIEKMAENIGLNSQRKIDTYIASGNWKKNAGGKGLLQDESRMDLITRQPDFECIVSHPKVNWEKWFSTIGEYYVTKVNDQLTRGELKFEDSIYKFELNFKENSYRFKLYGTTGKIMLVSYLTKCFTKVAYCELCGVCEIECPTGALTIRSDSGVQIDTGRCVHCHHCFGVNTKGCIIATRRAMYEGGNVAMASTTKTSGIDRYSTFGLRAVWLDAFFDQMDDWFDGYAGLGPKQIPAMINWLREAGLVDLKEKKTTKLAQMLKAQYVTNGFLVWQILWSNLVFNSPIANWYVTHVQDNKKYTKAELLELLTEDYPTLKETTLRNPLDALVNTFDNSPLGTHESDDDESLKIGVLEKKGNAVKSISKIGSSKISSIAIAYLLYKNAEENNMYELTVADIYEKGYMGAANVFGMEMEAFLNTLRGLTTAGVLSADLLGGLDNIHLIPSETAENILYRMIKK